MTTFVSIIAALVVLSVLVIGHELGHYCAGKLLGFRIVEFSVGMGPAIFKKEKKGILYAVRALPIGGMCRFYGEDSAVSEDDEGKGAAFAAQPFWKQAIVIAAGAAVNLVMAVIIATVILMAYGDYVPVIDSFSAENSRAEEAGILPGDLILAVDGKEIEYYAQTTELISAADPAAMRLTVERDGEQMEITVRDFYSETEGRNLMGVYIRADRRVYGFLEALGGSVTYVWSLVREIFIFFGDLIKGRVSSGDVMGPVGVISLIGQAVRTGFETVLRMAVLISANLGLFNLLPLPALDGGRLVFILIAMVRGKAIPPEKEGLVHLVGICLLLCLIVYLTFSDIKSIIGG